MVYTLPRFFDVVAGLYLNIENSSITLVRRDGNTEIWPPHAECRLGLGFPIPPQEVKESSPPTFQ